MFNTIREALKLLGVSVASLGDFETASAQEPPNYTDQRDFTIDRGDRQW